MLFAIAVEMTTLFLAFARYSNGHGVLYSPDAPLSNEDYMFRLDPDREPRCVSSQCDNQEECCQGTVCVMVRDPHGGSGVCAEPIARSEGKICNMKTTPEIRCPRDLECKPFHENFAPLGVCVNPNRTRQKKKFFDLCETTIECDTQQKLCCRQQRAPGRGQARKICSYFDDPQNQCVF